VWNCPRQQWTLRPRFATVPITTSKSVDGIDNYVVSVSFRARIAVILEFGDLQTLQPVPLHRVVPREELIDRQAIASAHFLNCDHTAQHSCDDRGFPSSSPALGFRRWQMDRSSVDTTQKVAFRCSWSNTFMALSTSSSPSRPSSRAVPTKLCSSRPIRSIDLGIAALTALALSQRISDEDRIWA